MHISVGTNNIFQPNTNTNNIRPSKMKRIRIRILFGMWKNIRIYSNNEKYSNYSNNSYILNNLDKEQKFPLLGTPVQCKCKMYILFNPYAAMSYLSSVLPGSANFHQLVRDYS